MMREPLPGLRNAESRGACVRLTWNDGFEADFAALWLLDNAVPAGAPVGVQRLRPVRSLSAAGAVQIVSFAADSIRLDFASEKIEWSAAQLRSFAHQGSGPDIWNERVLWPRGADIAARPKISYGAFLTNDAALQAALTDVLQFGLVRLDRAGLRPDEVERTVARFGFIRETNYGRLFEVRIVADPDNLASTAQALEPHTDNPYRDPAPTLQLLHCLKNAGEGGATFFLDGFALAESFREAYPDDFATLAGHAVPFAFAAASGERYDARTPVLRVAVDGRLTGIRFNHRALQAVDFEAAQTARWYEAYVEFAAAAGATARHFSLDMQPGDIVIFDNERILHGRDAFSGNADRLLTGCYADRDGLLATLARLRRRGVE